MQALADSSMSERSLYYWSRRYSGMLKSGDDYSKLDDANLREVGNMASVLQAELEFTADEKLRYKYTNLTSEQIAQA